MSEFRMAMSSLDPRTGGTCVNHPASKRCSYIVGYVQLVLGSAAFFVLLFNPYSVSNNVNNADTTTMVIAGLLCLFCIIFSVTLLLGLHKDRRLYVKTYCIYIVVYLVITVIEFIVKIVIQRQKLGFRGYFNAVVSCIINLFYFYVVRCYYLNRYCNNSNQFVGNQPKVFSPSTSATFPWSRKKPCE